MGIGPSSRTKEITAEIGGDTTIHLMSSVFLKISVWFLTKVILSMGIIVLRNIVRDNCDYIAKIPMIGKINSLNASVSCGIILSRIVASRIK